GSDLRDGQSLCRYHLRDPRPESQARLKLDIFILAVVPIHQAYSSMAGELTDIARVTLQEPSPPEAGPVADNRPHSLWWYSWRRLKKNRLAMVGLWVFALLTVVAIFADLLAPMDPNRQILEYSLKPSWFRGNILIARSAGGSYQNELIPINSY